MFITPGAQRLFLTGYAWWLSTSRSELKSVMVGQGASRQKTWWLSLRRRRTPSLVYESGFAALRGRSFYPNLEAVLLQQVWNGVLFELVCRKPDGGVAHAEEP
jgi:hypothetical protein